MIKPYKILQIDDLAVIQQGILDLMPIETLLEKKMRGTCYLYETSYIFERVPALATFFKKIGLENPDSIKIAMLFVPPRRLGPLHIDPPDFATYSINIPIINCDNTFMHYFKSDSPGEKMIYEAAGKKVWTVDFKLEDCELLEIQETNKPYIVNISIPHQYDNSQNDTHRYMLLCRIKRNDLIADAIAASVFN